MDEGFPGTVEARAWWISWEEGGTSYVELDLEAEMSERQPDEGVEETVVALTNHRYVRWAGCRDYSEELSPATAPSFSSVQARALATAPATSSSSTSNAISSSNEQHD